VKTANDPSGDQAKLLTRGSSGIPAMGIAVPSGERISDNPTKVVVRPEALVRGLNLTPASLSSPIASSAIGGLRRTVRTSQIEESGETVIQGGKGVSTMAVIAESGCI
jgi:hypothetical protein